MQAIGQRPAFVVLPCALQLLETKLHVDAASFL